MMNVSRYCRFVRCFGYLYRMCYFPVAALLLSSFLLSGVSSAVAQEASLRMAIQAIPGSLYDKVLDDFVTRVESASDGSISIDVYDSLIPGAELHTAVREGRVDIIALNHPYLSSEAPRMTIGNLPGLVNDNHEYRQLLDSYWADEMRSIVAEKYNAVQLMNAMWGIQGLYSRVPILSVDDFSGLKIRVHNGEVAALMNSVGASPTPIAASEMLPALERGVIDGIFTALDVAYGLGFPKVAQNVQIWPISSIVGFSIVMNQESWAALSDSHRNLISEQAQELETEYFASYDEEMSQLYEAWEAAGVEVVSIPPEESARMFDPDYVKPVYDAWVERANELGIDGVAAIHRAQEALGKEKTEF